jgi:hypothetical protein
LEDLGFEIKGGEGKSRKRRRNEKKCERRERWSRQKIKQWKNELKGVSSMNSRPLGFFVADMWVGK